MSEVDHPNDTHAGAPPLPVVVLLGKGGEAVTEDAVNLLVSRGYRVLTRGGAGGAEAIDAIDPGPLCRTLETVVPGQAALILDAGLRVDDDILDELARELIASSDPRVLTALSNIDAGLNPFARLAAADGLEQPAALVRLLARTNRHRLDQWPRHFAGLNAAAISVLSGSDTRAENAASVLRRAGGRIELVESWFLPANRVPMSAADSMEPHETERPVAWGTLCERLHAWVSRLPADGFPDIPPAQPATLHITHSWGGGVATWVNSFIEADRDGLHFQLRSEGPQSGQGAGQKLALYLGQQLRVAVDEWWLQPPIRVTDVDNADYRAILAGIVSRFGIGRVIISSLVGHALDAFDTGLPTMQVLHDHFPAWPLLAVHPGPYKACLAAALEDPRAGEPFGAISAADWTELSDGHRQRSRTARLVAPSQSVVSVQSTLHDDWEDRDIAVIPHGLPPLPDSAPVMPKPRTDGRLRVVIPGRVQDGKGARLLETALDAITPLAQVYLVGTGKGGERFFGRAGVNVIINYERDELPGLLRDIGPHLAALLSVVPETFNYALSEMQALAIPVVATRVGSFPERIRDGQTGWLVDVDADALIERLRAITESPAQLDRVRRELVETSPADMGGMITAYNRLCPVAQPGATANTRSAPDLGESEASAWRFTAGRQDARVIELVRKQSALEAEIEKRTHWAESEVRQRRQEAEEHRQQVLALNALRETQNREAEAELAVRASHIRKLDRQIEDMRDEVSGLGQALETQRAQHAMVLGSLSWRLTAPLRVTRRMLARARHARAWNPLRWPWLTAQLWRNLSTNGVTGTLRRMQHFESRPVSDDAIVEPALKATATRDSTAVIEPPTRVPGSDTPRVSIIIPAYRHFETTAACLASLASTRCDAAVEIIVADDASGDDSVEKLGRIDGLKLVAGKENLGFIGNCNRAAEQARGEFVCFLNNDTEVLDGWLDALLSTFEKRPDAGLVGARLVYADGRLQECGGLIFNDGSGWNYGRDDNPARPEYQYLRECDYVSGACIVLRRELWNDLGGFDSHYAPAYYEDTDLAFRVRARGLKVYVQPAATVIHHEGVSSGTDLASGIKRYQAVNRDKFLARWADELATCPAPLAGPEDTAGLRRARDRHLRGRVLLVDAYTPEPDQDSGSVRLTAMMRCLLDMGYGVTFFADNRAHAGRYTRALQADGVETWYDPWLESPAGFLREHGRDFGHIIVSRHYVATHYLSACRKWAPQAKFIFDTVDLHYLREQRLADLEDSPALRQTAKLTRRAELSVIRDADATLVVSAVEREVLAEDAPGCPVFILSNIHEVRDQGRDFGQRADLYFIGGYQHPPNIDAATWFVNDIWPRVHAALPDVRFHLIGSKAPPEVETLGQADGVTFHGFVDSLDPFLDGCRLSVAPLRYGAGVKGKVNQAMAHGQPVVATTVAVEGMHAEDGRDVLVADDADTFAAAIIRLYQDEALWNRIAAGGKANVEAHFSTRAAQRDLARVVGVGA